MIGLPWWVISDVVVVGVAIPVAPGGPAWIVTAIVVAAVAVDAVADRRVAAYEPGDEPESG